jgi:hypothetical protein
MSRTSVERCALNYDAHSSLEPCLVSARTLSHKTLLYIWVLNRLGKETCCRQRCEEWPHPLREEYRLRAFGHEDSCWNTRSEMQASNVGHYIARLSPVYTGHLIFLREWSNSSLWRIDDLICFVFKGSWFQILVPETPWRRFSMRF